MAGTLVVAEHLEGTMCAITGELITAATSIKDQIEGPVVVAVVGEGDAGLAGSANLDGVDEIVNVDAGLPHFDALAYEEAVIRLGKEYRPKAIFIGQTVNGMAYAAGVAARLGTGFASDVFEVGVLEGRLVATRGAYENRLNIEVVFPGKGVVVLTLRGATFGQPAVGGSAALRSISMNLSDLQGKTTHLGYQAAPSSEIDMSKAEFILAIGRGIQDEDNVPRFKELADKLGAVLGCSRPVVDSGWLPKAHQVGQSGTVASSCKVYLALGISGAVQHLHGMKHVDTVIAVNTDSEAPIFNVANYGAVVDVLEFAEALERGLA